MSTGSSALRPNLALARGPETRGRVMAPPLIQFSPASLRRAADVAMHVVHNSDHNYDEKTGVSIIDGDCADMLAKEFLSDLRADAPVFLGETATRVADEWMAQVVYPGASYDILIAEYGEGSYDDALTALAADPPTKAGLQYVQIVLPGAMAIWDGKPAQAPRATAIENVFARVNEQIAEHFVPLRAKVELMARILGAMATPDEGRAEGERIEDVLYEYGLPRPESEPRARARP